MQKHHAYAFVASTFITYFIASMTPANFTGGTPGEAANASIQNAPTDAASQSRVELQAIPVEPTIEKTASNILSANESISGKNLAPVQHQAVPLLGTDAQQNASNEVHQQTAIPLQASSSLPSPNSMDSGWLSNAASLATSSKLASPQNQQVREGQVPDRSASILDSRQGSAEGDIYGNADFERKQGLRQPTVEVDQLPAKDLLRKNDITLVAVTGSHWFQFHGDINSGRATTGPFRRSPHWTDVGLAVPPQTKSAAAALLSRRLLVDFSTTNRSAKANDGIRLYYLVSQSLLSRIRAGQSAYASSIGVSIDDIQITRGRLISHNGTYKYEVTSGRSRQLPASN